MNTPRGAAGDGFSAAGQTVGAYLSIARRRWKVILFVAIAVTALAAVYGLRQQKMYRAQALVEVSRTNLAATLTGTAVSTPVGSDFTRVEQTDASVAASETVALATVKAAHSDLTPQALLAFSSVTVSPDTDLLTFEVDSPSPSAAVELANAYADQYTRYQGRLDTAALQNAQRAVAAQVAKLKAAKQPLPAAITSREDELQVLAALQSTNTTLAKSASTAVQYQPRIFRDLVLGIVIGLLLGTLGAFAVNAIDTRVREDDEAQSWLPWPLLGRLPPPRSRTRGAVTSLVDPDGPEAEAFRILRARMNYGLTLRRAKSVMISSALMSEGKSTTAANLAVTEARAGSRVTLLDLDLRRPASTRLFGLPAEANGLMEVLFNGLALSDALQPIDIGTSYASERNAGSLHVMTSGLAPASVGELFASDLLPNLIRQLTREADLVVIDMPPLLGVGDVTTIAPHVDALLLIVRLGTIRRGALQELARVASELPLNVIGYALTGSEATEGYSYGYGYSSRSSSAA